MIKFFSRLLIILIISFPILYSSNSYAAKLTCKCEYVTIESVGSLCNALFPPMDIQTFLFKGYITVNGLNYEITSKNDDQIEAIDRSIDILNRLIRIDRNSGKTYLSVIATRDLSWVDGSETKKGLLGIGVYQCSKKKISCFEVFSRG